MNQQPYKKLYTYWFSVLIYDHTVKFCNNWIKSWKLKEQMTGAARSGKQNIVEGTDDMSTSLKIGIKLTGTSKGSLEELIGDLVAVNWLLTLCHQATFLLYRQIEALKRKHQEEGGFTENLYKKRIQYRNKIRK